MVSVKQRWLFQFLCAFLVLIPLLAGADGKVFTRAVAVPVTTPDQRALLYFTNGVERLVIETSFVGEGTNFAWVVPLPSAPKIEAVSENFFPSLSTAYQPELIYKKSPATWLFAIFGGMISLAILAKRKGAGCLWLVMLFLFFLILGGLGLPNLTKARAGGSSATAGNSVEILNQERVGIYETVTLSGTDGRDLLDWLNTHQFYTPTNALPILSRYAAQKWVFVAATIHRENESRVRSQPHPLAFTFSTEKAVYPLQLTGVENARSSCSSSVRRARRRNILKRNIVENLFP